MIITILVSDNAVVVAIAHTLSNNEDMSSKKKALKNLQRYFALFGESCIDDHRYECGKYLDEARQIFIKYFKY